LGRDKSGGSTNLYVRGEMSAIELGRDQKRKLQGTNVKERGKEGGKKQGTKKGSRVSSWCELMREDLSVKKEEGGIFWADTGKEAGRRRHFLDPHGAEKRERHNRGG